MRLRIALAILTTSVAALVLAAVLTAVVLSVTGRDAAEERVASRAAALADAIAPTDDRPRVGLQSAALARLADALDVDELVVVVVLPDDSLVGEVPASVTPAEIRAAARSGEVRHGRRGDRAWATAPVEGILGDDARRAIRGGVAVVVATDPARATIPAEVPRVFGWVALGTVAVGAGVAVLVARSLTRPLRRAETATGRIAAGDLSARVEEPPRRTGREIVDLSRSINEMATALERSRTVETQFLLSVSHDLRTPLTSIRGWSEAITDGTAPDPGVAAAIIGSEARRLDRLVDDLLLLARLDTRRFNLVPTTTQVGPLVAQVCAAMVPDATDAGVTLSCTDVSNGATASVDPDRLAQVIANLVENALKFATATVRVTVAAPLTISVVDDGPGIAGDDLPHVFERLYVSRHRPVRRESGSGLGLAIVRELVTAMGGTVEARSPGGGTEIRVTLPLSLTEPSHLDATLPPTGRPRP